MAKKGTRFYSQKQEEQQEQSLLSCSLVQPPFTSVEL